MLDIPLLSAVPPRKRPPESEVNPLLSSGEKRGLGNRGGCHLKKGINGSGGLIPKPHVGFNAALPHLRNGFSAKFFAIQAKDALKGSLDPAFHLGAKRTKEFGHQQIAYRLGTGFPKAVFRGLVRKVALYLSPFIRSRFTLEHLRAGVIERPVELRDGSLVSRLPGSGHARATGNDRIPAGKQSTSGPASKTSSHCGQTVGDGRHGFGYTTKGLPRVFLMIRLQFALRLGSLRHLFLVRRIKAADDVLNGIHDTPGEESQSFPDGLGGFPCAFKNTGLFLRFLFTHRRILSEPIFINRGDDTMNVCACGSGKIIPCHRYALLVELINTRLEYRDHNFSIRY